MEHDITRLKRLRQGLGLTQAGLAEKAGVSQSVIAKIESGKIDPGYSIVSKLFSIIENIQIRDEKQAKDIMCKKIVTVSPKTPVKQVILLMKKHSISQLPVVDNSRIVGIITESSIVDFLSKGSANLHADSVMQEPPPIIGLDAPLHIITSLLKRYSAVLVTNKGDLRGIITKSDLLGAFS